MVNELVINASRIEMDKFCAQDILDMHHLYFNQDFFGITYYELDWDLMRIGFHGDLLLLREFVLLNKEYFLSEKGFDDGDFDPAWLMAFDTWLTQLGVESEVSFNLGHYWFDIWYNIRTLNLFGALFSVVKFPMDCVYIAIGWSLLCRHKHIKGKINYVNGTSFANVCAELQPGHIEYLLLPPGMNLPNYLAQRRQQLSVERVVEQQCRN